ncbi:MAG: hypothetical protein Q8R15_03820 [Candidatus Micrarchaeota archaeon]|nr:hypothetical protein [Candidatus Micrarchaeota archaeon]
MTGLTVSKVNSVRKLNLVVRGALHKKVLEIAMRLNPRRFLNNSTVRVYCSIIPQLAKLRRKFICEKIATYNGRPTTSELARHVTGKGKGADAGVLSSHREIQAATTKKLLWLFSRMSEAKIRAERLDRNASPKLRAYLNKRFKRKRS